MADIEHITVNGDTYDIADSTARDNANSAANTATDAATAASNAQKSAETAQSSADAAQTAASSAQSSADKAQSSADNAQSSADAAQKTADGNSSDIKDIQDELDDLFPDSAGGHNSTYRGKYLGTEVTDEQWAAIKAGTFKDLYPGDYWTLNGYDFLIADLDYGYMCGNTRCTSHHIMILSRGILYTGQMNESNTTESGYAGSEMYQPGLDEALEIIENAFGADHILERSVYLTDLIRDGRPSGGSWLNEKILLPNEEMIYGCPIQQQMSYGGTVVTNYTIDKSQLAVCRYNPEARLAMGTGAGSNKTTSYPYWLRDIASATYFCCCGSDGYAYASGASNSAGVRPVFAIYQS